jgi:hypothetical protein
MPTEIGHFDSKEQGNKETHLMSRENEGDKARNQTEHGFTVAEFMLGSYCCKARPDSDGVPPPPLNH